MQVAVQLQKNTLVAGDNDDKKILMGIVNLLFLESIFCIIIAS